MWLARTITVASLMMFVLCFPVEAADDKTKSYHYGLFHPNGLGIFGYSVEKKIDDRIYRYYTFGLPSGASIGYSYYSNFNGDGLTATIGIGIGIVFNTSIAYQFHLGREKYVKVGAGYTTNISYTGMFPVLSYEQRF